MNRRRRRKVLIEMVILAWKDFTAVTSRRTRPGDHWIKSLIRIQILFSTAQKQINYEFWVGIYSVWFIGINTNPKSKGNVLSITISVAIYR